MRVALTVGAMAAAVSLVVAMTSAFTSLHAVAYHLLDDFYSAVDVVVTPDDSSDVIADPYVRAMQDDARVREIRPLLSTSSLLIDEEGGTASPWPVRLRGLGDPAAHDVGRRELAEGEWFPEGERQAVAVIGDGVAQRLDLEIGSTIALPVADGDPLAIEVVGILTRPEALWMEPPAIYLPLHVLQEWAGYDAAVNRIEVVLQPDEDVEAFAERWQGRSDLAGTELSVRTEAGHKQMFDQGIVGMEVLSYAGGAIAMLAAAFIIFSTLSMGVAERSRVLAMLRAIGAVKPQIAALVLIEGLVIAVIGAALGVLLGWLWIALLAGRYPDLFLAGGVLNAGGVIFGVGGALLAALLASLLPAITATRIDPLQAMTAQGRPPRRGMTLVFALLGLALVAVEYAIVLTPGIEQNVRLYLHLGLGLPTLLLGLFLITPACIRLIEPLFTPLVARLFAVRSDLLRQQLSSGLWRTAGTVAALSVGLATFVAIQAHGRSLIADWQLPDQFPDMILFSPLGIAPDNLERINDVPGIREGSLLPVALVSPELGTDVIALFGAMQRPNATMMFGVNIDRALGSDDPPREPMIGVDYLLGDPATARRALKQGGRTVVITEEFQNLRQFSIGDTIPINTTNHGEVDYEIVGVMRSLAADRAARLFDLQREMESWTVGSMITSIDNVRRDFGIPRIHLFMANLDSARDKEAIVRDVREAAGERFGLLAADTRELKEGVDEALFRLVDMLSAVALAALAVASLGVLNTIMASVRARRWQLGVFRCVGLTRAGLIRLVITEAVLIGLIASALGVAAGLILAHVGLIMGGHLAGYAPPLVVPVRPLMVGVGITLAVTLVASVIPALLVGRTDPLRLLQAGRSS